MDQVPDRPPRLALIEVCDREGRVTRSIDVTRWPLSIGRALDNDLVLDDPWAAAHHARVENDGGRLGLRVLPGINGVLQSGTQIAADSFVELPAGGGPLQVGATRMRLRLPGEVLAPERPLPGLVPGQRFRPALIALALVALVLINHWLLLDPGAPYPNWLPAVIGLPVVLIVWCGGWALMSKLFQHRFDFGGHLRIALPWMLAIGLTDALWPQLAAMLGAPWLWQLSTPLQALLAALMVRAHLDHLLPGHRRMVGLTVAAFALAAAALSVALSYRSTDRLRPVPYMSTLPLPALRLSGTVAPRVLVDEIGPLSQRLAERVKKARAEDQGEADSADDSE